jgi:hypothetical protein
VVAQCREAGVPAFVKQMGTHVRDRNDIGFQGDLGDEFEDEWPSHLIMDERIEDNPDGYRQEYQGAPVRIHLHDRKGGDPNEWPVSLRVRQFPQPRAATP